MTAPTPGTWASELLPYAVTAQQRSVLSAIEEHSGNVSAAASFLGLSRSTVRSVIERCRTRAEKTTLPDLMPVGQELLGKSTFETHDGKKSGWTKTKRAPAEPSEYEPKPPGFAVERLSTMLDSKGRVGVQWVGVNKERATAFREFWDAVKAEAADIPRAPAAPMPPLVETEDNASLLAAYVIGDMHTGMMTWARETGQDFDLGMARDYLRTATGLLVKRAPAAGTALLVDVGDWTHAQTNDQLTPRGGNKLDCDSRSGKIKRVASNMMRDTVDQLLGKHLRVLVIAAQGNHNPDEAINRSMWLEAVYENEPRVEILDNLNPYTYVPFGKTLIGITHTDGPKPADLPLIMATDQRKLWGDALYCYWLTGHLHTDIKRSYRGCKVETFETLAPEDYWAHWKGYRSNQSMSVITYSSEYGETSRAWVDIRRIWAARAADFVSGTTNHQ